MCSKSIRIAVATAMAALALPSSVFAAPHTDSIHAKRNLHPTLIANANAGDEQSAPQQPALLAPGTVAPNFTVHDIKNKPIKLSHYRGKVVVIDFWATWCGPCQQSLPSTNKVARKYRDKGVIVLGINVWDTRDAFAAWLPQHKDYDAIHFAIDPQEGGQNIAQQLYNVSGIPTQYVIGRDGKIVTSLVGFSGSDDDLVQGIETALKAK